jgi:GT2 family glycosyltransferase
MRVSTRKKPASRSLPTVSVVVPACERRERLRSVVTRLLDSGNTTEVIVPLTGRDDGSLEMLRGVMARDPRLTVIPVYPGNLAASRASGFDASTGDVVLFVDDDVVPVGDLAGAHARVHSEAPGQVVLGYMPVPTDGRRGVGSRLYSEAYEERVEGYEASPDNLFSHFWAGNFSLRREDCERVGLWSPEFDSLYHEDRDFGLRCRAAGLTPRFVREAEAKHLHDPSAMKLLRDAHRHGKGLVRLEQLHGRAASLGRDDPITVGWLRSSALRIRIAYRLGMIAGAGAVAADKLRLRRAAHLIARVGRRLCRDSGIAAERARGVETGSQRERLGVHVS